MSLFDKITAKNFQAFAMKHYDDPQCEDMEDFYEDLSNFSWIVISSPSAAKAFIDFISKLSVSPNEANPLLTGKDSAPISQSMKLKKIYSRPNITSDDVLSLEKPRLYVEQNNLSKDIIEQVEIQVKYSGYIEKEKSNAEKLQNLENISIPAKFNYSKLKSLSSEARSKLEEVRPKTLSQASRISGVSPSDISSMLVYMGR